MVLFPSSSALFLIIFFSSFFSSLDRKSTRLNSSHANISYAVFCLKKKNLFYSLLFTFHYHSSIYPHIFYLSILISYNTFILLYLAILPLSSLIITLCFYSSLLVYR